MNAKLGLVILYLTGISLALAAPKPPVGGIKKQKVYKYKSQNQTIKKQTLQVQLLDGTSKSGAAGTILPVGGTRPPLRPGYNVLANGEGTVILKTAGMGDSTEIAHEQAMASVELHALFTGTGEPWVVVGAHDADHWLDDYLLSNIVTEVKNHKANFVFLDVCFGSTSAQDLATTLSNEVGYEVGVLAPIGNIEIREAAGQQFLHVFKTVNGDDVTMDGNQAFKMYYPSTTQDVSKDDVLKTFKGMGLVKDITTGTVYNPVP